ncbi:MAG: helix-turn-helix transcriptional regulator [Clostridia bacterium]|nr:helix-turn-helix transcriptional regulator [Clostridia bacterium]
MNCHLGTYYDKNIYYPSSTKWQLSKTDTDILNICYDCGYNTPSQFIKMFKRETGITPSEYRKLNSGSK